MRRAVVADVVDDFADAAAVELECGHGMSAVGIRKEYSARGCATRSPPSTPAQRLPARRVLLPAPTAVNCRGAEFFYERGAVGGVGFDARGLDVAEAFDDVLARRRGR